MVVMVLAVLLAGAGLWFAEAKLLQSRPDIGGRAVAAHDLPLGSLVGLTVSEAMDVIGAPSEHIAAEPRIVPLNARTRVATAHISAACFTPQTRQLSIEVANRDQLSSDDWRSAKRGDAPYRVDRLRKVTRCTVTSPVGLVPISA
ncbi:hypothetical protein GCM10009551_097500 [Nocardiopsis tropica]|nr:hypothetical protein TTY48_30620 [Tsukamurella sp. TY48]